MRQNLNLVTLGVQDLGRSLQFYRDGLGWKPSRTSQEVAFFQLGAVVLALYPRDKLAEDATVSPVGSGFPGITLAYNTRSREEVDEVLQQAEQIGGRIVKPAQDVFWGGYSGYFADPDGYLWEVAWNPFWELDAAGHLVLPEA
ncbi:VOC family protein [Kovacikia minuta CCNUW1]|uniref:VOC family protein n=1 Tax=Kovacikia minuta TaxID=2931930 RepID=UPI001CC9C1C9|nr:VOC family protein [Kovacikia minuta]UBF24566.1 VOC family protein [Kovacikia minuta CCNUW1]